ncbi:MAG: DUF4445 domain-containing protein [Candidatus Omnitrophica bacterium]|nr:DUF4445 domain-containing protein [Candidatus Omnitrophota bacterium]
MRKTSGRKVYGVALDIGTTDIKGSLLDLASGKELASANILNEQKAFGQDVITRLYFATKEKGLEELNKRAVSAVNKLMRRLAKDACVGLNQIKDIVAVGNSTMYHLMLMIKPDSLARAPFLPAEKKLQRRPARGMGLSVGEDAVFKFLPNISGFVGSDTLASILAAGIHRGSENNMIIDVGTNGEIALGSKKKFFVASCASGPAFEGRHIKCGMSAGEGAIIRAKAAKKGISLKTIGDAAPKGIAGSGLIDIISILLRRGIVAPGGRMEQKEFVIYEGKGGRIYITRDDVRQVQLAKGALASGIEILMRKAGLKHGRIKNFYITGAFGTGVDKKNAKYIGLIPKEIPDNKIKFLKEGALSGARRFLLKKATEKEINGILSNCAHVQLHKDKDFEEIFTHSMRF